MGKEKLSAMEEKKRKKEHKTKTRSNGGAASNGETGDMEEEEAGALRRAEATNGSASRSVENGEGGGDGGEKRKKRRKSGEVNDVPEKNGYGGSLESNGTAAAAAAAEESGKKKKKKNDKKARQEKKNASDKSAEEGEEIEEEELDGGESEKSARDKRSDGGAQDADGAAKRREKKKGEKMAMEVEDKDEREEHETDDECEKKKKRKKKRKGEKKGGVVDESAVTNTGTRGSEQEAEPATKTSTGTRGSSSPSVKLSDAERLREELGLTLAGNGMEQFPPIRTFRESGLPDDVIAICSSFEKPSPIQSQSWPVVLAGRDLVGIASTGSGKTIAFAVPALMHLRKNSKKKAMDWSRPSPVCLVLSPTRELAQQIADVFEEAGAPVGVKTACIYGGMSKGPQRDALRRGATVVVATPGRLMDLMEEGVCSLKNVNYLVLDEADRMLDLGFEAAIRSIIKTTSSSRQTLMFSATWPQAVGQLASEFLNDPMKITVGSQDLAANHSVKQIVEVLDDRARDGRLDELLRMYHKSRKNRVLVFVLYKKEAVRVESLLMKRGWNALAVHGDKSQAERTNAVNCFKDGSVPLLIATDVAARGLDIPDVEYVINYSFPLTTEDYVHRIGRTGRAGKTGVSHTFFTISDKLRAGELMNVLREAGQEVPESLMKFGTHVKKKESKLYGAHFREISADAPKATKIVFGDDDE